MKIAVISDLHSNILALDSVLNDIISRKVDTVVCTGDLVGYLPYPKEVVNRIREKNIMTIKGNHDEAVAKAIPIGKEEFEAYSHDEVTRSASLKYTTYTLDESERRYLDQLPESISLTFEGLSIRFVHGSPNHIAEYMYERDELLEGLVDAFEEDVIVSGHTHIPYHKIIGKKHFVNAGSVGKPKHGNNQSSYVVLQVENGKLEVEVIEVSYEVSAIIREIEQNPYISDQLVESLRQGI